MPFSLKTSAGNKGGERKSERGLALIVVIFVIATLTIIVVEFVQSTSIDMYIASNVANGMKAFYLSKSGVMVAAGALLDDIQDEDDKEDHQWEDWAQPLPAIPAGEGWVTVELVDESSKFNINRLVRDSGLPDSVRQEVFKKLLLNLELNEELINPIIDWLDEDDESTNGAGPESSAYGYSSSMSGESGYTSKNGKFLSMAEIGLVNGITADVYEKLKPYITIYGNKKLNLNTVDQKVLEAYVQVLSEDDDVSIVENIIAYRDEEDVYFKAKSIKKQLTEDIGVEKDLANKLLKHFSYKSNYFSVSVEVSVGEATKRALGVVQRSKKQAKVIYFRPI